MKKVIALALALTLALSMASVAFAADLAVADFGEAVKGNGGGVVETDRLYPGATYQLDSGFDSLTPDTASDYGVKAEWTKGGALVESVKINKSAGKVEVKFNENYTISDAKALVGSITLYEKADKDNKVTLTVETAVGNNLIDDIDTYGKVKDAKEDPQTAINNTIYKCDDAGYIAFNTEKGLFSIILKMVKDEKAFLYNNEDMIDDIEDKYGDIDAEINCYQFGGRPTFKNAAQFTLQADYADQYFVYEWDGKKLTKQDYTWNSIEGVYEWNSKSPKSYVISDKELVAADEDEAGDKTDENPDTGANDVVGVAAALAVVSLVAAGAVSLKK